MTSLTILLSNSALAWAIVAASVGATSVASFSISRLLGKLAAHKVKA